MGHSQKFIFAFGALAISFLSLISQSSFAQSAAKSSGVRRASPSRGAAPQRAPTAAKAKAAPTKAALQGKPATLPEKKPRAQAVQAKIEAPNESNVSVAKLVRVVRASDPDTGVLLADITALVVNEGYLLLPLEFVSDVALARNNVRFFLDEGGKVSQEVFLTELDLDAGLALFKTSSKLTPSLSIGRVSEAAPQPNDSLISVSTMNVARPGGKFLKAKQDVSTTHFLFALASGPSTPQVNYVFDRDGELVGVASGPEKNGAVWAASGRSVAALIRRAISSPAPASVAGLEPRHRQLISWQDRWTQALNPSKKGIVTRFLDCRSHHASISDEKIASQVHRFEAKACDSRFSLPLGGGYEAGIQMQIGEAFIKPSPSFNQDRERSLASISEAFAAPLFSGLSRTTASVNLLTSSDCRDSQAINGSGQRVAVRFCTSALKGESGLNDTSISVASLDTSWRGAGAHAYVAAVRLKGFGQTQTRRILEAMIENPQEAK